MKKVKILLVVVMVLGLLVSCGDSSEDVNEEPQTDNDKDITESITDIIETEKDIVVKSSSIKVEDVNVYNTGQEMIKGKTVVLELDLENPNKEPYEIIPKLSVAFDSKDNYGDIKKVRGKVSSEELFSPYKIGNYNVVLGGKESKKIYYYIPLAKEDVNDGKIQISFDGTENTYGFAKRGDLDRFYDWKFDGLEFKKIDSSFNRVYVENLDKYIKNLGIDYEIETDILNMKTKHGYIAGNIENSTDVRWQVVRFTVDTEIEYDDGRKEKMIPFKNNYYDRQSYELSYITTDKIVDLSNERYWFYSGDVENGKINLKPVAMYYVPEVTN